MHEPVADSIRAVAYDFLRGSTFVFTFYGAFNVATSEVINVRPLHRLEVALFEALEGWESSRLGPADRHCRRLLSIICRDIVTD